MADALVEKATMVIKDKTQKRKKESLLGVQSSIRITFLPAANDSKC
jgi:hypothetical protein